MNENKSTHLKCISNGRVFMYTDILAERDDMVACNAQGDIAVGHIADANDMGGPERRKTPFLGNVTNGVLYPWTDILAERDDMISIDSREQWDAMKKNGEAPAQAPDTVAPKLGRSQPAEKTEGVPHETVAADSGIQIPNIEGMGAREAKTVLSEWAEKNFGRKLNRKPALSAVLAECEMLIGNQVAVG